MKATDIKWDTDGDKEVFNELPAEIELPNELTDGESLRMNGIFRHYLII